MSDLELFDALKQGDDKAFESLFQKYFKVLTVFANQMLQDLDESQDLVQDVFIKLYENRSSIEIHTSFKAFLYQSVRNKCLDKIRSNTNRQSHHDAILVATKSNAIDESDQVLKIELEEKIYEAIKQLPEQCQLIFNMSRFEGKKNQLIAEALGISKRTVETQISNALKKLRVDIFEYLKVLIIIFIQYYLK